MLKFEVDPEMPNETLQDIADVCGAIAASLAVRLVGAAPGTGASVCLNSSAMRGLSSVIGAVSTAAMTLCANRPRPMKITSPEDLLRSILDSEPDIGKAA